MQAQGVSCLPYNRQSISAAWASGGGQRSRHRRARKGGCVSVYKDCAYPGGYSNIHWAGGLEYPINSGGVIAV